MIVRKVEITLTPEFVDVVADTKPDAQAAVGKLACWAIEGAERYTGLCSITGHRNGDLSAKYRNPAGDITYDLLAQRRDDGSYGFHS